MSENKKIILFEGELKGGKGHHYDHLVENSFYYKNKGQIFWVVNKKFEKKDLYIPEFVKVFNIIDTANRKITLNNFFFSFGLIYISLKNFLKSYYILVSKLRINIDLIFYILKNFLFFPKYFSSFCDLLRHIDLNENDKIIFQTSRINEIELAFILIKLKYKIQIHLRVIQLHRKRKLKKFNKLLNQLNYEKELNHSIFLYTETDFQKEQIKKLTNLDVELFYNNLSFSEKNVVKDRFTIGILGESRFDKGFYKIPDLIINLNDKISDKIRFIIQINNCPKELLDTEKKIVELSKKYKNIQVIRNYINFFEYREILKNIDIIPLLHELNQLKNCGSGIVFSSMVNEIPMIIPKGAIFVKKFYEYDSFLEADNINQYSDCVIKIINEYPKFLEMAKKQSFVYKNKLNKDFLNNRI